MIHVPYQGAAPALNDLIKGQIDVLVNSVPGLVGLIGSDRLKVLAVLSDERVPLLPDVPTLEQAGQQPIELGAWLGMFGPAGLAPNITDKISSAVKSALSTPQIRERFASIGVETSFKETSKFTDAYRDDVRRWKDSARKYNLKVGQ